MSDELNDDRLETEHEQDMPTSEPALATAPEHLKPPSADPFRPAACHADRPIYGSGPLCRKCADLVRWQGERGKAKVHAYVADNPSLNAAMRADVEDKIGQLKAYERKPEKERKYVDTRKPSVAKWSSCSRSCCDCSRTTHRRDNTVSVQSYYPALGSPRPASRSKARSDACEFSHSSLDPSRAVDSKSCLYCTELATCEKTVLAFEPINRIVPTTITRITASITAYSAMS